MCVSSKVLTASAQNVKKREVGTYSQGETEEIKI